MCRIAALMVEIRCRISLVSHHCEANPACLNGNRDFWVMSKHRVPVLLLSIVALVEVHWAQGVDNVCPQGWEEKARAFSEAKLNGDVNGAAEGAVEGWSRLICAVPDATTVGDQEKR